MVGLPVLLALVLGCVACGQSEKQQKMLEEQAARTQAEKERIQKETALIQDLISNHKDFAVCVTQQFHVTTEWPDQRYNYDTAGNAHCPSGWPSAHCQFQLMPGEPRQLSLLIAAGYIQQPRTETSRGTLYYNILTDKGLRAIGNEIKQEGNGLTMTLGCRELQQVDATTQLSDGLKIDFSWHWKLTDLGTADGLADKRERGVAYFTRTTKGLVIDQIKME